MNLDEQLRRGEGILVVLKETGYYILNSSKEIPVLPGDSMERKLEGTSKSIKYAPEERAQRFKEAQVWPIDSLEAVYVPNAKLGTMHEKPSDDVVCVKPRYWIGQNDKYLAIDRSQIQSISRQASGETIYEAELLDIIPIPS